MSRVKPGQQLLLMSLRTASLITKDEKGRIEAQKGVWYLDLASGDNCSWAGKNCDMTMAFTE